MSAPDNNGQLKVQEIAGAYVGRHCEVVNSLGQRIYPEPMHRQMPDRSWVNLGCNRDACNGFVCGYWFAKDDET